MRANVELTRQAKAAGRPHPRGGRGALARGQARQPTAALGQNWRGRGKLDLRRLCTCRIGIDSDRMNCHSSPGPDPESDIITAASSSSVGDAGITVDLMLASEAVISQRTCVQEF